MCGGSKTKGRRRAGTIARKAAQLKNWQKNNPRASTNFSKVGGNLGKQLSQAQRYLNRTSGTNRGSSRTRSKGSKSTSRKSTSRNKNKTSLVSRVKTRVKNAVNRVTGRSRTNKSSSTTRIPSVRQARSAGRKAKSSQKGTVKTRKSNRQIANEVRRGTRSSYTSQFSR